MAITEDFFGSDKSDMEYDHIALSRIKPELLSKEKDLLGKKWWDYRFDHPVRATYYFAHCYTSAYRRALAKRDDFTSAQFRKGFKGKDPLEISPRETEGFWKARQFADEIGIPYELHVSKAMEYAEERDWMKLPRPQQLYGAVKTFDTTMRFEIENFWYHLKLTQFMPATHPNYTIEKYQGKPEQIAYQKYLLDFLKDNPNRFLYLGELIVRKKQLSQKIAERFFGEECVKSAVRFALQSHEQDLAYNVSTSALADSVNQGAVP